MAHFARLEDNAVTLVIVVSNDILLVDGVESEDKGVEFCHSIFGGEWKQTSYNHTFRKNFAGIGYTYDPVRDAFISPKPFESWTLNEDTCRWEPPVAYPSDDKFYDWDEETTSWVEIEFVS
jgi:hypothetical protein